MPRAIDKDLVLALQHIRKKTLLIHLQLPSIRPDDLVNALTYSGGKTVRAAEILSVLHHRRSAREPCNR